MTSVLQCLRLKIKAGHLPQTDLFGERVGKID